MRVTAGMSCTINPRPPRKLTDAQSVSVELHPLVRQLRRRRDHLKTSIWNGECQPRVDVARTLISGTRTPSENIEKRNSSKEPRC